MTIAFSSDFQAPRSRNQISTPIGIAFCALLAIGAIGARAAIVRIVPPAAVLFEAIGVSVNLPGLALERVKARIVADGERRILLVEGDLVNPGGKVAVAKSLIVSLRGQDGQTLYSWTTPAPQQDLAAGDRAAFLARLASPPAAATSVQVEFERPDLASSEQLARPGAPPKAKRAHQGSRTESQYR